MKIRIEDEYDGVDLEVTARGGEDEPFFRTTIDASSKEVFALQAQRIVRAMAEWDEPVVLTLAGPGAKILKGLLEQDYVTAYVERRRRRQKEQL